MEAETSFLGSGKMHKMHGMPEGSWQKCERFLTGAHGLFDMPIRIPYNV